jgi:hypothetical protein
MRAALFPYVWRRGVQCHGADGCPGESYSSRGVVACPVLVQERLRGGGVVVGRSATAADRFEGAVNGGPYAAQWRRGDVLSPCTPAASGMSSQCMVWRYSGGDGRIELTATRETAPAGLTSRRSLA